MLLSHETYKKSHIDHIAKSASCTLGSLCVQYGYFFMKEIQLTRGMVALVDDEDFQLVNEFKWNVSKVGKKFYAETRFEFKGVKFHIRLHQFILGVNRTDHVDGDGLNCQRLNMRECTQRQNCMNRSGCKNKTSKYKGVHWYKAYKKWVCQIKINKKVVYTGYFINEIDAAKAYDQKAKELFGEFAWLNFKN